MMTSRLGVHFSTSIDGAADVEFHLESEDDSEDNADEEAEYEADETVGVQ